MSVSVELVAIGDPELKAALKSAVVHGLSNVAGDWRVSIVGSQSNDLWELRVKGPNTERRFTLDGAEGQHDAEFVRNLLSEGFAAMAAIPTMPAAIQGCWARLSNGEGDVSDVQKVISFFSQRWAAPLAGRIAFDEFLVEQGINQKIRVLSAEELNRFQAAFEKVVRRRILELEGLFHGISRGPVALEFFSSLTGASIEFKELAYIYGLKHAPEENRLLIICALSREATDLINRCLVGIPREPLPDAFRQYLMKPGDIFNLQHRSALKEYEDIHGMSLLLQISSLAVEDQCKQIHNLAIHTREILINSAHRLFRKLPIDSFGKMIRMRMAIFICLSDPSSTEANNAKETLISTASPIAAETLACMPGDSAIVDAFRRLQQVDQSRAAYASVLLDHLRRRDATMLNSEVHKLREWSKTKYPILSLAAQAALLSLGMSTNTQFENVFLRSARADKDNSVGSWLARNNDFLGAVSIGQLPHKTWRAVVIALLKSEPALARSVIISGLKRENPIRYWQESLQAISETDPMPESLFDDLVLQCLQYENKNEVLNKEPVRSLVKRRFWELATRVETDKRILLFDAAFGLSREGDFISLVEAGLAPPRSDSLRAWILSSFIPVLLEKGLLGTGFGRMLGNRDLKKEVASILSSRTLEHWNYLKRFPDEWVSARTKSTQILAHRLRTGIQVAMLNSRPDSPLHTGIQKLSGEIEDWLRSGRPGIDSALLLTNSVEEEYAFSPDESIVRNFFSRQPSSHYTLALFLGYNLWALQYLFHEQGPWPNPDIILEQLSKTFILVASLRQRASDQIAQLQQTALIDLAIAIRGSVADLESEVAGLFTFRKVLEEIGIHPAAGVSLGASISEGQLSDEKHKVLREPGKSGRLRVFASGMRVGSKVIDTAIVMKSGVEDDRD